MRRIVLVFAVAAMMAVMLVGNAVPALAQPVQTPPPQTTPPDALRLVNPGCPALYSNTPLPTDSNTHNPDVFLNAMGAVRCDVNTGPPA